MSVVEQNNQHEIERHANVHLSMCDIQQKGQSKTNQLEALVKILCSLTLRSQLSVTFGGRGRGQTQQCGRPRFSSG